MKIFKLVLVHGIVHTHIWMDNFVVEQIKKNMGVEKMANYVMGARLVFIVAAVKIMIIRGVHIQTAKTIYELQVNSKKRQNFIHDLIRV